MAEGPDRLNIDKTDKALYDELLNEEMFKGKENKALFLFAMATGFMAGDPEPLKKKEGFVRSEYLRSEDEALLNSLAIYCNQGSADILLNRETVYSLAEQYAHCGIKILINKIRSTQFGSYHKQFEKELHSIISGSIVGNHDKDITR